MTATWRDYWELTKPRIAFLVLVTAAFRIFLGRARHSRAAAFLAACSSARA